MFLNIILQFIIFDYQLFILFLYLILNEYINTTRFLIRI